jgi:arginine/lysine/ornithine decarboxylase
VDLKEAVGEISSDIITIYPPGIPLLVPGEEIQGEIAEYLQAMGSKGARVDGLREAPSSQIRVVAH